MDASVLSVPMKRNRRRHHGPYKSGHDDDIAVTGAYSGPRRDIPFFPGENGSLHEENAF